MASKLPEYFKNCKNLLNGEIDCYQSDADFAFCTGQLIRYLLDQSESSNKNHSMFTPFLQKTGDFDVFISQINRTMMTYSHKLKMNFKTVDRLMSNTTGYELKNKTLKELETMLICGYFANSAIYETLKKTKGEENE